VKKGSHHTKETIEKNRKAHLGKTGYWLGKQLPEYVKEKISEACKGRIITEETKKKISLATKGKNNPLYGKHHSEETKRKISEASKKRHYNRGEKAYWYGKSPSVETRLKISLANKGKVRSKEAKERYSKSKIGNTWNKGKGNWNWQGGKSFEEYTINFNKELKELIRQRDNYQCQLCGMPECENIKKLCVHHIDYDKKNCLPSNLISLCRSCHTKTNHDRGYWKKYFKKKLCNKE